MLYPNKDPKFDTLLNSYDMPPQWYIRTVRRIHIPIMEGSRVGGSRVGGSRVGGSRVGGSRVGGSSERALVRENELSNTGSAFSKFASYKTSYTNLIQTSVSLAMITVIRFMTLGCV